MNISLYQIVKHDGMVAYFDVREIAKAIERACEAEREVDSEIDRVLAILCGDTDVDVSYYQDALIRLKARKRTIRQFRKEMTQTALLVMRNAWMKRNRGSGRSNTSAVSDMMLQTIPTPPTSLAANRSLQKWGMMYGTVA